MRIDSGTHPFVCAPGTVINPFAIIYNTNEEKLREKKHVAMSHYTHDTSSVFRVIV